MKRALTSPMIPFVAILLFICSCIAPPPSRGEIAQQDTKESVKEIQKVLDNVTNRVVEVNQGLQTIAREVMASKEDMKLIRAQAEKQADVNGNGKVDDWEKPFLASALSSLVLQYARGKSRKVLEGRVEESEISDEEHRKELAALKERLARVEGTKA